MKKIEILNETNRMKEMMGVPLTEAVIEIEPSVDPQREEAVTINAFGVFPVSVTKNDTSDKFIAELVNKIKEDENLSEKLAKGELKIKNIRLRGGASNWNNVNGSPGMGIVEPEVANSSALLTSFEVPEFTEQSRYKGRKFDGNVKHNTRLAKRRAGNLWKELSSKLPKAGISVEGVNPTIVGYNVDTGGKVDRRRNKEMYKVPGQHVFVEILLDQPVPEEEQLVECLAGVNVVIGYFKRPTTINGIVFPKNSYQGHVCNYATFRVLLNGTQIGNVNLNNDKNKSSEWDKPKCDIGTAEDNNQHFAPQSQGGQVYNIITVTPQKAKEILSKTSNPTQMQLSIVPNSNAWLRNGKSAHGDAPMVGVFKTVPGQTNPIVKYKPQEPYKGRGDVSVNAKVKLGKPFDVCEGEPSPTTV